jgi:PAS domain S-box-containing protein
MVGLVLLTSAGVGYLTHRALVRAIVPEELSRLDVRAQRLLADLDDDVRDAGNAVKGFRSAVAIRGVLRARSAGGRDPETGLDEAAWWRSFERRIVEEFDIHPAYLQFRCISALDGGREVFRVDRSGAAGATRVVPASELQVKADRPYYVESLRRANGEVYVSPIELNQERGVVEVPHVPVIRVGTPLFLPDGERFGILIVNLDVRRLTRWPRGFDGPEGATYLADGGGNFLFHPDPGRDFSPGLAEEFPGIRSAAGPAVLADRGGRRMGIATATTHLAGGPEVTLVAAMPEDRLLAPMADAWRASVLVGSFAALVAAIVGIALSRSLQRTTDELRESEQRFHGLLESLPQLVWTTTAEGVFDYLSPQWVAYTGLPAATQLGSGWLEQVHPDDRAPLLADWERAVTAGSPVHLEFRIRRHDGAYHWFDTRAVPLRDADGRVVRWLGTNTDIQLRKEAEEGAKRWASLFEEADFGVAIGDAATQRLIAVNPAFARQRGYAREELAGMPIPDLYPPEERAALAGHLRTCDLEGHVIFESRHLRKDGSTLPILLDLTAVRDGKGNVVSRVACAIDLTERTRAREAVQVLEEQLRQAQKMESIGLLAGGIAHDFNNILTVIQGHACLLLAAPDLPARWRASAAEVEEAAERAARLTAQLLTFSRRQVVTLRDVDLNEIVRSTASMLERIVGEDVDLRVDCEPAIPKVRADVGMLEQVLVNLAANARDAMRAGGRLIIRTARHAQGVALEVEDTGHGIPADQRGRIFEPFFTTKGVGEGTGLGLATVYGIVEQHHGTIEVESEVGVGTNFRVVFPAVAPAPQGVDAPRTEREIVGGTETLLLVEDERAVRDMVRNALGERGYTILEAETGVEAMALWSRHRDRIRLIVTDMVMPGGVSGRDLARAVHLERPDLPVVYTSGYSADLFSAEFTEMERVDFLQKPYSLAKLAQVVRAALDRSGGGMSSDDAVRRM